MAQETQTGALYQSRGVGWGERREWTYVCLWLIHVDIWQKTTKFCKAIILQEKEKKYPAQSKKQNKQTTITISPFSLKILFFN